MNQYPNLRYDNGVPEKLSKGTYRIIGYVDPNDMTVEPSQFLDFNIAISIDGDEHKRQRVIKCDVMADGRLVIDIEVIENVIFTGAIIWGIVAATGILGAGGIVLVKEVGNTVKKSEKTIEAVGNIGKQVIIGVIIAAIGYFYFKIK
jgi:hypothetical protein